MFWFLALLGALGTVAGIGANYAINERNNAINEQNIKDTNATNLQIARETNAQNKEQAELAYLRSLPVNQVKNYMQAGMSKAGALSALSGAGQYVAPVMQGATAESFQRNPFQVDTSQLSSIMERLSNVPAVSQQMEMNAQSLKNARLEYFNSQAREKRAQEAHDSAERERLYTREENRSYDMLQQALEAALTESGKSYDDIKSVNDIRKLIGNTEAWKNRKGNASTRLFNDVTTNRGQLRSEVAAEDAHNITVAQLRDYVDKHKINVKNLEQLTNQLNQWNVETEVRQKELYLRSLLADFNIDQTQVKKALAQAENIGILTKNADGSYSVKEGAALAAKYERYGSQLGSGARAFWTLMMDIFGLTSASDLLKGLVSIAAAG